jgi:hypothetical protein
MLTDDTRSKHLYVISEFVYVNILTIQYWKLYSLLIICDWLFLQQYIVVECYLLKRVPPSDLWTSVCGRRVVRCHYCNRILRHVLICMGDVTNLIFSVTVLFFYYIV